MKKIVCTMNISDKYKQMLIDSTSYNIEFIPENSLCAENLGDVEAIIGNLNPALLADCHKLEWLQISSAGADKYLKVLPENVIITNSTGAYGVPISEYMMAMLMMPMKNLHIYRDNQRQHLWQADKKSVKLFGSTVLIVGLGDIGTQFAKRIKAMGTKVIGIRRTNTSEKPDFVDEIYTSDMLNEVLGKADIVAITAPGTAQTSHMFGVEQFALMKSGAFIINVGRGTIIDTEALCSAIENGKIGGAALDVTDPEPLPTDHRLWELPNVIITPHICGEWKEQETFERVVETVAAENLKNYSAGKPLKNIVDRQTGYRTVSK